MRDQIEDAQHGLALADDVLEVVALLQRALELDDFLFGAAATDGASHVGQQLLVVPGLLDEVGRARLHGVDGVLYRAVRGDHDHRQFGIALANLLQNLDAVPLRQGEVEQHEIEWPLGNALQSFYAIVGRVYGVAFKLQKGLERLADGRFVVNNQHRARGREIIAPGHLPAYRCLKH